MALNQEQPDASLSPILEPGETVTLKLPFHMLSGQYRPSQWEHVEERTYMLTYALYPVKQSIQCGD